ncbi:hypothetical protein [Sphingomonas sp. CROZ-RG-20F-R02-07]|uniref:hypothetical protein n=1 Tax=Sphingomonas sp. CROZ-RG-20F-R02-07 TaxID=2914832 RepID=UPI001F5A68FC|nr:hypothetical protein [Sphingomonas sp. CROZ-RG-20F-R02-07]
MSITGPVTTRSASVDAARGIVASPDQILAWLQAAGYGDRLIYATRTCLPAGSPGAAQVRKLYTHGMVLPSRARHPAHRDEWDYFVQRTSRPLDLVCEPRPERPKLALTTAVLVDDEAAIVDALLPVISRFASHGRPCPTDKQLADKARLTEGAVKAGLQAMAAANLIRVQGCAAPTYRRIIILASGAITGIAA